MGPAWRGLSPPSGGGVKLSQINITAQTFPSDKVAKRIDVDPFTWKLNRFYYSIPIPATIPYPPHRGKIVKWKEQQEENENKKFFLLCNRLQEISLTT